MARMSPYGIRSQPVAVAAGGVARDGDRDCGGDGHGDLDKVAQYILFFEDTALTSNNSL